jgi:DNA-3-methyladenine glycosylase II
VLGRLQQEHDWLQPVLFHSPYEAAAWSIISARRYRNQAVSVRTRICAAVGAVPDVAGEQVPAFPLSADLLAAESLPGMDQDRVAWLHTVALTFGEPRLASYVAHFYGTGPAPVSPEELAGIAENWRPFRTWAAVLIRAAGDRAGLASLVPAA